MSTYWDQRFIQQGMVWGKEASETACHARTIFTNNKVKTLLIPGAGYGRNSKAFSSTFEVTGIELSGEAIRLAAKWDPGTAFIHGSVLDTVTEKKFDAVYCYDVLHLFLLAERKKLIQNCVDRLNEKGMMYFTCFSDQDPHKGQGKKLEEGTYEYMEGKHAHFFTEEDLRLHFNGLEIIETGTVAEVLKYEKDQKKEYMLRYIIVKI
ncbi:class I SAM-dependent methyltransferase [Paenibacillus caui]|uniref:class I SAM-dependent methyltransferase n=1 Tax=Paenibacillus caui TaxID=2873927 RepID=UPI001CAA1528|nr:class I SAM-dependent methyltransferase [Paenibacillus caui]